MDLIASLSIGTGNVWVKEYLVRYHVPVADPYGNPYGNEPVQSIDEGFNHPFVFSQLTVSGLLCVGITLWFWGSPVTDTRVVQVSPFDHGPPVVPPRVYLYCALLFYLATVLVNMNYAVLSGSVIQMLRGSKVIFTYLLSVHVLEKRMHAYHGAGAMLCVCGCLVVGLQEISDSPSIDGSEVLRQEAATAVFLCIVAEVVRSILFVYQEQSMRGYQISPIKLSGIQGLIGTPIGIVAMYTAYVVGIEDVPLAASQMSQSAQLDCVALLFLSMTALWELSGTIITKRYSAVTRTLLELTRTMALWFVDMMVGYQAFCIYHLVGLSLLFLGLLVYQHILVIPQLEPENEEKPLNIVIRA